MIINRYAISELRRMYPIQPILFTSLPGDPLHEGHVSLLLASKSIIKNYDIPILVVAVNDDQFLINKKGYVTLPAKTRISVIDAIRNVDYTFLWYDGTQTVAGAIELLRPNYFLKGGDRTPENFDPTEKKICDIIGCTIVYGVGGDKIQSSSKLCTKPIKK
jgi:bifunctional ADP-heptose synthase (sugar kinase/adenylyltransferase)